MESKRISIIIPYYNTLEHTKKLLANLNLQRRGTNTEVILIDDCSDGESLKPLVDIYIRNEKNCGVCHSRNVGLNAATGDFITFIDCDDMVLENYMFTLVEEAKKGNDLTWISWRSPYGISTADSTKQINIAPWGCIFSKRIFEKLRFNETFNIGEEPEFWEKVFLIKDLKIGFSTNLIYEYIIREESLTRQYDKQEVLKKKDFNYLATIFIPVYNQEEYVIKALDSLPLRDDIDTVVLDDGSKDNTYKNLKEYRDEHPERKFTLLHYKRNRGLGAMKNIVYKNAKGVYIGELDSDDYVYTNEYNKVLEELDMDVDIVYMNLQTNSGEVWQLKEDTKMLFCGGPCKFIKKDLIGKTRCAETKEPAEDWQFNLDIQAKPHIDKFTNITAYHYNFPREGSLSAQQRAKGE